MTLQVKKSFFKKLSLFFFPLLLIPNSQGALLRKIEFVHSENFGELLLDFDQSNVGIKKYHNKKEKQIILDLTNVKASEKVMRAFDTSEFSGALVFVSPYTHPNNPKDLRITLSLRDNVRSIIQKRENQISISIENRFGIFDELSLESSKKTELNLAQSDTPTMHTPKSGEIVDILDNLLQSGDKKYVGKKISFNVRDIRIDDLLKMIADTSGFNIILNEDVSRIPPLTLSLTNIPWDQALDTIFKLGKLVASKNGNILIVTTLSKAMEQKLEEEKAKKIEKKKEPLVTKIYPVSFAKSEDIIKLLKDYTTPKRGSLSIDNRTNALIIKDTMETIERMGKIIETLDTQTPQIQIEAKVVEASDSFKQNLGLQNGLGIGYDPVSSVGDSQGPGIAFSSASNVIGDKTGATGALLNMSVGVYKRLKGLNFMLQLQETQSKLKILSSPKVITQNNMPAKLLSTSSTPFQETAMNGSTTVVTWKQLQTQLNLEVTPKVTNEGSISMAIEVTKGSFEASVKENVPPGVTTRTVKTNVLVENGSTAVLGGLYTSTNSESHSGVPFLKDIPIIGWLFRSPYNPARTRSELIIFITPRVVNQEGAGLVRKDAPGIQMGVEGEDEEDFSGTQATNPEQSDINGPPPTAPIPQNATGMPQQAQS